MIILKTTISSLKTACIDCYQRLHRHKTSLLTVRESSQSGFPDQNCSSRLPESSRQTLREGTKPAGYWAMMTAPVPPASSHLPSPPVAECCLQAASPGKSGSRLLHRELSGGQRSRRCSWRRPGTQAAQPQGSNVLSPSPSAPTPLGWRVSRRAAAQSGLSIWQVKKLWLLPVKGKQKGSGRWVFKTDARPHLCSIS